SGRRRLHPRTGRASPRHRVGRHRGAGDARLPRRRPHHGPGDPRRVPAAAGAPRGREAPRTSPRMTALPPDYDSDPERWQSWKAPHDVHEMVAREIRGPVLDIGCGEGRLASLLERGVAWVGVDASPTQL